jgi:3-oxoacyl-[acyl-carrier protein] reductase
MQKVALVTGASRGIGRGIAIKLAADGYRVAVNYHQRASEAQQVAEEIRISGGSAIPVQGDVGSKADVTRVVETVNAEWGPVDVLVNNAGVLKRGDIEDFDFAEMEGMRRVNVDGLVAMTRAVLPGMKERGWGRIVNITSVAAIGTAFAGTTFYSATKAAVVALTRRFAMDLGQYGITVNAVAPGFILTDMVGPGHDLTAVGKRAMMRRVGMPEDIGHAVSFLVSDGSSFITAQVLTVDGGRMDYIGH